VIDFKAGIIDSYFLEVISSKIALRMVGIFAFKEVMKRHQLFSLNH
jgi:hypothetical protein